MVLKPLCFNPCFRGTCSWCLIPSSCRSTHRIVSILVFVELALDGNSRFGFWIADRGFQSLFSWNLLLMSLRRGIQLSIVRRVSILVFVELALDGTPARTSSGPHTSFNPCFRGTCSWCILYSSHPPAKSAFQSLFSWNLLLMFIKLSKLLSDQGFNPCFRGTCSWCYFDTFLYIHLFLVSILVFVELALDARNEELTNSS